MPTRLGGKLMRCFRRIAYPRLLKKFLLTALLAIFLGTMKEIAGFLEFLFKTNLKVKFPELTKELFLKIPSIVLLLTLFFFLSIKIRQRAFFCLYDVFVLRLFCQF